MKIRVISKWQALVNQRQKLQFCFFKRYTCLWGSPVCAVQQNWKERTKSHSMMTNYLELYYKVNKNSQNSIKELNDFQGMLRKISYTYLFTRDKKMHIWKYVHTSYFRSASITHYIIWNQNVTWSKFHKVNSYLGSQFLRVPQKRFNVKSNP